MRMNFNTCEENDGRGATVCLVLSAWKDPGSAMRLLRTFPELTAGRFLLGDRHRQGLWLADFEPHLASVSDVTLDPMGNFRGKFHLGAYSPRCSVEEPVPLLNIHQLVPKLIS